MFDSSFPKRRREKFLPEEDQKLRELVSKFGENAWEEIVKLMPGRNIRQCRERWKHYLSSDKAKVPWTPEEDQLLYEKMEEYGPKWTKIATFFNNRTDIQVKTRWMQKFASHSTLHLKNRFYRKQPIMINQNINPTMNYQQQYIPHIIEPQQPQQQQQLLPTPTAPNVASAPPQFNYKVPTQMPSNIYKVPQQVVTAPSPDINFTLYQANDFSFGSQSFWEMHSCF